MEPTTALLPLSRRSLLPVATAWIVLRPSAPRAQEVAESERFIRSLADRTFAALDRPAADPAARTRAIGDVLKGAVDLDVIARVVLGRHWAEASEAQRADYGTLFRPYAVGVLAQRFGGYAGTERFVVTGSRPVGADDRAVSSEIVYGGGYPPLHLDWRVRSGAGRLVIVDVVAEGVSWVLTTRSEFDAVVARRGLDGLLREMRVRAAAVGPAA
jgi:phospholipid transport system substrate-binding protein